MQPLEHLQSAWLSESEVILRVLLYAYLAHHHLQHLASNQVRQSGGPSEICDVALLVAEQHVDSVARRTLTHVVDQFGRHAHHRHETRRAVAGLV